VWSFTTLVSLSLTPMTLNVTIVKIKYACMQIQYVLFGFLTLWSIVLTAFLFWFYRKVNFLIKEAKGEPFIKVLEKIVNLEKKNTEGLEELEKEIKSLDQKGLLHIQKIGIVRFNPFNETGGDHSFSLAVMNAMDTGFVLTSLHTRERTRLYTKLVVAGKSTHDLSKEELQAIRKASLEEK
jgi:hypothetical protein